MSAAAAASSFKAPAGSLPTGLSTLAGHTRLPTLTGPAESGTTLVSIGVTPGCAIQVLIPPFAHVVPLSTVKVRSVAHMAAPVPFACHIATALPIK